jgi:hypothetical protein
LRDCPGCWPREAQKRPPEHTPPVPTGCTINRIYPDDGTAFRLKDYFSGLLEVLRAAVGLEIANQPRWFFLDSDADLSHIDRNDTRVEDGIRFDPAVTDMSSLSMTGVLLGNMQEYA